MQVLNTTAERILSYVPLDREIVCERINVHTKEAYHESQRQENEGDPAQPPHACA